MIEKGLFYVEIRIAAYIRSGSVIIINLYRKENENADIYSWSQHKEKSSRKTMPTKHPPINGARSVGTARVYTTLNVFSSRCID